MKLNKIFFAAAALVLGLVACQTEQEWEPTPADEGLAVYFVNPDESGDEVEPGTKTAHDVIIKRQDSAGELAVKIAVTLNDSNVFDVPENVTFAAGVDSVVLTVGIDTKAIVDGVEYNLILEIDPANVSAYTKSTYKYSITQLLPTYRGVFVDEIISGYAWYVDYTISSLPDGGKQFVILNPYTKAPVSGEPVEDEYGVFDADPNFEYAIQDGTNYNLVFTVDADGNALMEPQLIGLVDEGGEYVAGSIHFIFNMPETFGKLTPDESLIFSAADQALGRYQVGQTSGYAAGLELWLSVEAYQTAHPLEDPIQPAKCVVEDYVGTYLCTFDEGGFPAAYPNIVTITSGEDEDGQYYEIIGLPGTEAVYGYFDPDYHFLQLYPFQQSGAPFVVNIEQLGGDVNCLPALGTLSPDSTLNTEDNLTLVCNADSTISVHPRSATIGYTNFAYAYELNGLVGYLDNGFYYPTLTPISSSVKLNAPAKKANKLTKSTKVVRQLVKEKVVANALVK